jgi:hypothetical protein
LPSEPQAPYYLERISEGFIYSLKFTVPFHVTVLLYEWPTSQSQLAVFFGRVSVSILRSGVLTMKFQSHSTGMHC